MNLNKEKREEGNNIQNFSRCVKTVEIVLILLRNNPEATVNFVLLSENE